MSVKDRHRKYYDECVERQEEMGIESQNILVRGWGKLKSKLRF